MQTIARQVNISNNITFICDRKRHLICKPYSEANMLFMATELGINPLWHHKDHYDIPINKIEEVLKRCIIVSPKEIVRIIKESSNGKFREKYKNRKRESQ